MIFARMSEVYQFNRMKCVVDAAAGFDADSGRIFILMNWKTKKQKYLIKSDLSRQWRTWITKIYSHTWF